MRRIVILSLLLFGALAPRVACDEIRIDHREGTTGNYSPVRLTTTTGHVLTFDAGGLPAIAAPAASGVALGDSPTWTGAHTFSRAGAASAPTISLTGAPFTGGTATTTKPLLLLEPTGTTSTGWSTSGTLLGANAPSGFAGNLIDAQLAGAARFKVDSTGKVFFSASGHYLATNGAGNVHLGIGGANAVNVAGSAGAASLFIGGIGIGSIFTPDTSLWRIAAGNLRLGNIPSATPLAQTFTIGEASRPGTDSNVAGANGTIQSGLGTGTGTGSSLVFQTPTVAGAGSGVQSYATRLTLNASGATVDALTATTLAGDGAGITGIDAGNITGTFGDIAMTGTLTRDGAQVLTPNALVDGASIAINVTKANNTFTVNSAETFTFSATPATGTIFSLALTGDASNRVITIPSCYSFNAGGAISSFTLLANTNAELVFKRNAASYCVWGDPYGSSSAGIPSQVYIYRNSTGTALVITDLPVGADFFATTAQSIIPFDATGARQARIFIRTSTVAAFAGTKFIARYFPTASITPSDYLNLGTSEISVSPTAASTWYKSAWIDLAEGAKADVFLAAITTGGNATVDPSFTTVMIELR